MYVVLPLIGKLEFPPSAPPRFCRVFSPLRHWPQKRGQILHGACGSPCRFCGRVCCAFLVRMNTLQNLRRPAAARAAPTPHHAARSAWQQKGARKQATYWAGCRLHGYCFHDAVGHRARRLHHAALITMCRRRPEVRPSEQAVHGGSTSSTPQARLMAAAT